MVHRIIWDNGGELRGAEIAIDCRELTIFTTKKTYQESINRRQVRKTNPIESIQSYPE